MAGKVKVRIAPSPTGDPHVGTAYVALFNYAFAKYHEKHGDGGCFVLRIEDTDRARSTPESEEAIMRALRWLGLQWDEGPDVGGSVGPYRQSERGAIYSEHAQILIDRRQAYPCFCTADRLAALRQTQRVEKLRLGYDGACRDLDPDVVKTRIAGGEAHVVRLRMLREGDTVLDDQLRGPITISNEQSDDQVLLKSDGMPTYHLANVVDDHLMGITHVIRAEEWISSAPKHLRLYEAFDWQPPRFLHLPLLRNNDKNKSKISKRRNPVSVDYYRDSGIIPEAMVNFLGLMGWSYGDDQEKFSLEEMIDRFDLATGSVSLSGPVFDLEKLSWMNGLYMREFSDEALVDRLMAWRLNRDYLLTLAPLLRERIRRFDEFIPKSTYFFAGDLDYSAIVDKLVPKKRVPKETAKMVAELVDALDTLRSWDAEQLEATCREFCERTEWKSRDVFMLIRLAVTGSKASPPLFDTMVVIGRELCRRRLRETAKLIKTLKPAAS